MASAVPVRNVFYLLCYAWNRLAEGQLVDVSSIDRDELGDLFARMLISGVRHLLRRGLERDYLQCQEEVAGIRGRVALVETHRRFLDRHGRASCTFDELTHDTLANRILKATMRKLASVDSLDAGNRWQLRSLMRRFGDVSDVRVTRADFSRVRLHGNNRPYHFLMSVCRLVHDCVLVDEGTGRYRVRDFLRDHHAMAKLFESFVFHFFRIERPDFEVKSDIIRWDGDSVVDPTMAYLPTMRTDICLRNSSRTVVIDAKYYSETLEEWYDAQRIHSAHLYQLVSYLKNLRPRGGADADAEGMLLYPTVNRSLRLDYTLLGHRVRICTVDLAREWPEIDAELRGLV